MIYRPADAAGDILPVLSSADLLRNAETVARLVYDRLSLFTGEWWENEEWGNEVIELLQENRITEQNRDLLSGYLTSYIRETPGVREVRDAQGTVSGRALIFSCMAETEYGPVSIDYTLPE